GGFAAIVVLLAGCEKEEKAVADLVETQIVKEEVHQVDEAVVDSYWSQPVDSEICQTIGECRDLGDTYGSEHFISFLSGLTHSNQLSFLNVNAVEDDNIFAI